MVLKNSKWDKKAKYKFMKKHGISSSNSNSEPKQKTHTKWSSKIQSIDSNRIKLEDSEDEWDSDIDDALLEHFYPSLSEQELTLEQKIKLKQQILTEIENQEDEEPEEEKEEEEIDGIYLGSSENQAKEMAPAPPAKFNLDEFISNIDSTKSKSKNRKLLSNKISNNFLEEYGLSSYNELNKDNDDYNDLYHEKQRKEIHKHIDPSKLDGFIIGQSSLLDVNENQKKSNIRTLTQEEIEQDEKRKKLEEEEKFYRQIRSKFGDKPQQRSKVIEINNFNVSDKFQLNDRLVKTGGGSSNVTDLDEDLIALGIDGIDKPVSVKDTSVDVDELLNMNKLSINKTSQDIKPNRISPSDLKRVEEDDDFLNQLLK
ncbi:hypothetical protein JA1_002615 [Spathaspora sp. JA1]|nr:hypothetical protein JA1_002615 [Spathaspora sp. JA1]